MCSQRTESKPQSPRPVADKSQTPVFFRHVATKKTISAQVDSAADLASLTESIRLNPHFPPSHASQIKISLAGKSLRHDQALAAQGLRPYQTLSVDTPALLGGMINDTSDDDDDFKRASVAPVDEIESMPLAPPTGTSLNKQWANGDTTSQKDLNSSQISKVFAERYILEMKEMIAALPEDAMSALHYEFEQFQDWYDPLSDERKKLACGVFVNAFSHSEAAKAYFEQKEQYLMDILNSDRQHSLLAHLRCYNFCWQVLGKNIGEDKQDITGPIHNAVSQFHCLSEFCEPYSPEHITHSFYPKLDRLRLEQEGIYYHMPSEEQSMSSFLGAALPEQVQHDLRPLVRKYFSPLQALQLIFVLSPEKFDKYFITDDSPTVQKLLVEFILSAKHENLNDLMVHAISTHSPTDDASLLECLKKVYLSGSHHERQVMLDLTSSCQLRALWLRALSAPEVRQVIRQRDADSKFELLNLCTKKVVDEVIALLPKIEGEEFKKRMLLSLTGYPRKTFDELETEVQNNMITIEAATRKFLHAVTYPGKPNGLVCVELGHTAAHYQKEDEKLREVANISVTTKPLFDRYALERRLLELDEQGANGLCKDLLPVEKRHYIEQMTMKLESEKKKEAKEAYRISYWEVCKDSESLKYIKCHHSDEIIPWRQGGKHVDNKIKNVLLFEGQNKEIFWFCKRQEIWEDAASLDLYILCEGMEEPTRYEISKDTELYRVMIHGNDDKDQKLQVPNAVPTMITPGTPVIVFKSCNFSRGGPGVYFYDVQFGKEIARAQSANLFVKYLPQGDDRASDKLSFLRIPQIAQRQYETGDEIDFEQLNISLTLTCKEGFPTWYTVDVDFSQARVSSDMLELIDMDNNDCQEIVNACNTLSRNEITCRTEQFDHWGYAQNEDFESMLQMCQSGAVRVRSCQETDGLFTVNIMVYDPDADVNFDFFYKCNNESEWHRQYFNQQFHCFPVEDESNGKTTVMKINPRSGLIMCASLSDPENDDYTIEWPVKDSAKGHRWFIRPTIYEGHFIRTYIDSYGVLRVQTAKVPEKGAEKLESNDYSVEQATIPYVTDYPIMAHWHPWNQLMISHLSDLDQGSQIFKFEDVNFVCFLSDYGMRCESRVNFLASDKETGKPCIIVMSHEASFKQAQTRDLNKWCIQRLNVDDAFEKVLAEASDIRKAFLLYDCKEETLRSKNLQPAILYQTSSSICLVQKQNLEIVMQDSSTITLRDIDIVKGVNNRFFYVQKNSLSQTDELVELKLVFELYKFYPGKRVILNHSAGTLLRVMFDSEVNDQTDSYWTQGGQKKFGLPHLENRLFLLDSEMNKRVIAQVDDEDDYQQKESKSLHHVKGLKKDLELLKPHEQVAMKPRCLVVGRTVYDEETGLNYDAFHDNMDEWEVLNTQMIQLTDKVLYNMRHMETGQVRFILKTHPGSRATSLLGMRCRRDVISTNQVSANKILFLMQKEASRETYWTLMDIMGEIHPLPASLGQILENKWPVRSDRLSDGKFSLLLTDEFSVSSIRFSLKGNLMSHEESFLYDSAEKEKNTPDKEIMFDAEGMPVKNPNRPEILDNNIYDKTVQNKDGHIFRIFIKEDGDTVKPKVMQKQTNSLRSLTIIVFENGRAGTDFLIAGNYLCWIEPDEADVHVLDTRPILNSSDEDAGKLDLTKDLRTIDNKQRMQWVGKYLIQLNACSVNYAIHAQPSQLLTDEHLEAMRQHIQVSVINFCFIFDLAQDDMPCIKEHVAIDSLLDCQKYVEPGFQICRSWTTEGQKSGKDYGTLCAIEASEIEGVYVQKTQQNILKETAECPDHWRDEKDQPFQGLYRTFSELNMFDYKRILGFIQCEMTPKEINVQTIFSCFEGQSIFSLLDEEDSAAKAHKAILTLLKKQKLEDEEDEFDEKKVENRTTRRLKHILNYKTSITREDDGIQSRSVLANNISEPAARDLILKIGRLSPQYNVMDEFGDEQLFKSMLKQRTNCSIEELDRCFRYEGVLENCDILWPKDHEFITYRSNSCEINTSQIQDVVDEKTEDDEEQLWRPVSVTHLNIDWIYKKYSNFLKFATMLQEQPDQFYETQFVKFLFEEFWEDEQWRIIKWQLTPYVLFLLVSLTNFQMILKPRADQETEEHDLLMYTVGVSNLLLWGFQTYSEAKQFWFNESKLEHFKSGWNWFDPAGLVLTFCIILTGLVGKTDLIDDSQLRVIAAFASFCIFAKAFGWLRMFENTGFYILLVEETLKDIGAFMIILFASLLAFGLPIQYLNLNRTDENAIVDGIFGFWGLDILFNQYLLALGEFNMDNFADNPQSNICYVFFILATFITQLTMLNMLIAIMGDTFGRVMEQKEINATKTKIGFMSDMSTIMSDNQVSDTDKNFLIVVRPEDTEDDAGNEWEGAINAAKNDTNKHITELTEKMTQQIETVREQLDVQKASGDVLGSSLKQHIANVVETKLSGLEERIMAALEK